MLINGNENEKEIMDDIRKDLKSKNRSVRALACKSLSRFNNRASAFLLVSMLSDRDPDVRFHASQSLIKLGQAALSSLVNALGHDEWIVRRQSSDILKKLSLQTAEVSAALKNTLNSDDGNIRYWSIKTLCEIKDPQVVPLIKKIFKSAKAEDKICIAGAITCDEIDREFKELLISGLSDSVWNVRKACADALLRLGPAITGDLLKFLYVQDADKFYWCAKLLGMIKDERAIGPLLEILETADEDRAETAIAALGEIGSRKACSSLIKLLGSASWTIRKTAADALISIGESVFDELNELYAKDDTSDDARYWCVRIAGSFKCDKSCGLVLRALTDRKWFVRACACGALANFYEITKPMVEKLYSLLGDKNTEVCRASEHALDNIDRERLLAITSEILDSCSETTQTAFAEAVISFWRLRGEEVKFSRKPQSAKDKAGKKVKKISVKKEPADHE